MADKNLSHLKKRNSLLKNTWTSWCKTWRLKKCWWIQEQVDYPLQKHLLSRHTRWRLASCLWRNWSWGRLWTRRQELVRLWEHVETTCATPRQLVSFKRKMTSLGLTDCRASQVVCGSLLQPTQLQQQSLKHIDFLEDTEPIVFAFHPSRSRIICSCGTNRPQVRRLRAGTPELCAMDRSHLWKQLVRLWTTKVLQQSLTAGGNAMVAAYSCGKPALGVGAGNVPACWKKSANIRKLHDIVMSKSFWQRYGLCIWTTCHHR